MTADRPGTHTGRSLRAVGRQAARAAVLGALAWSGAAALGLPEIAGIAPSHAFALAALVAALLGAVGAIRVVQGVAALVALLLVLVTSLPLAARLGPTLVRRDRPPADSGATVDAVAVLSSGVDDDGLIQGEGVDRLLDGLALARRTDRPVVLSVVHPRHAPAVSSRADQMRLAALAGVDGRVWTVDSVHTTHDEAVHMAALARAHGWHRVALVTSPTHSRRACATFERAGLAVVCTPARAREASWGGSRPLHTSGDRLRVVGAWLYETIGWYSYRARGWI